MKTGNERDAEVEPLTFATLDGLAFAAERGTLSSRQLAPLMVSDLGPFLEYLLLANQGKLPKPENAPWLRLSQMAAFYHALSNRRRHLWICPTSRQTGIYRVYERSPSDDQTWIEFSAAAQFAAVTADFPRAIAAQLVGAIGEMEANTEEHSQAAASGVAVFRATPGMFEFAVADRGVGVLQSLKSCPEYSTLSDHGDALRLTITDGVSRHGSGSGHGHGFSPLFTGLANLHGFLRFRSGDHALTIEGTDIGRIPVKVAQKTESAGFYASVRCHLF